LTIGYAWRLRFGERHPGWSILQLGLDALLVSAFIYFTGGVHQALHLAVRPAVIAASTIQLAARGLLVRRSARSSTAYRLVQYLAASVSAAIPAGRYVQSLPRLRWCAYTVAMNVFGLVCRRPARRNH